MTSTGPVVSRIPAGPESDLPSEKRKRRDSQEESSPEKNQLLDTANTTPPGAIQYESEIDWKDYFGSWPPLSYMDADITPWPGRRGSKRAYSESRTRSYSQSVRDGDSPQPWTRQHEEKMKEAGLIMNDFETQVTINDECLSICDGLVKVHYQPPTGPYFKNDRLCKILDLVCFRNERRVFRDVTPFVVPSPELLNVDGYPGHEHIREASDAEWTQCTTLCGPRPKPDLVTGIAPTAFTREEKEKLTMNHSSLSPNLFPENMYYPFLLCEVKSDRPLREAERQCMHGASVAIEAIVQLYKKISATDEINRKILVFSVAHNSTEVKIFGHFASIGAEATKYFRRPVFTTDLVVDFASTDWIKSYNVTRAIYDKFFPVHLERIKSALSRLPTQALSSSASKLYLDDDPARALQDAEQFNQRILSNLKRLEEENERLQKLLKESLHRQQPQIQGRQEQTAPLEQQMVQEEEMLEQ